MNENLVEQIKMRTILIFKTIFSNCIILNRLNTDCKDKIDDINQMNCYAHITYSFLGFTMFKEVHKISSSQLDRMY